MKVPIGWLQEYLNVKLTAKEMAAALEKAGVEVEQLISSKKVDSNVVVGFVKKVVQHPEADRLKLAEVDDGKQIVKLVCGAPNLKLGQKVALARVNAVLADGRMIKAVTIRDQVSAGMLCSAAELGLSDDDSGILVLGPDLDVGTKLCDIWSNEDVVDIKTHANRPDLQSIVGLAREIAAVSRAELITPPQTKWVGNGPPIEFNNELADKVWRYMAGDLVVGLESTSPDWMKQRLQAAGIRPINIIVDVTNYVMLELGQPLHAFDATKVKLPITIRAAKKGEKITTLDGVERSLAAEDVVIADTAGVIALAGVMGGRRASVTENTRRIILEAATFDGPTIRKTAQRHNLRSESSARFERCLPVQSAPLALNRAAALLVELAGAQPSGAVKDKLEIWPWVQHIGARSSRLSELFGTGLSRKVIAESLQKLGFEAEEFDVAAEARKHLGKPYKWGANFKQDGTEAFDCSYLVDYIYSLIGLKIGHTALGQFELGKAVHTGELRPGDVVFYEGKIDKSVTDHYFTLADDGTHLKHDLDESKRVGHNGIYVGDGKVVMAAMYGYENGNWTPIKRASVVEVPLTTFTENPSYLGARRYDNNLEDYVAVTVPWWRPDVKTQEDILEEVARIVGYDSLPATLPVWRPTKMTADTHWPRVWQTKAALRSLGLFEVYTYSFISGQQLADFGYTKTRHLKLRNPLSIEQEYLRRDLLPSLVAAVARNVSYSRAFGLFEISRVFLTRGSEKLPEEPMHLGVIIRRPEHGYKAAKAALDLLIREFHLEVKLKAAAVTGLYPGRSAEIIVGSKPIGYIGEVHPDNLRKAKIKGSLGFLEIDLNKMFDLRKPPHYRPISKFPAITRDLSLELKSTVTWEQIRAKIAETEFECEFLSEYYGSEVPDGYKSLAVRLEMNSHERTLTDREADEGAEKVFKVLQKTFGAKLRS